MRYLLSLTAPLQSVFWQKNEVLSKKGWLLLAGVIVLTLSAQLRIPFQPVPLTFQSATVVLIGMAYGARYATYTIAAYLIAGACGLPVFADFSGGLVRFFGPTGGYLIGFLPAAFMSGYLAEKGWARNSIASFIAACLGESIIYLFGIAVLSRFIGWQNAFFVGAVPFILPEIIKLIAISLLTPRLWKK